MPRVARCATVDDHVASSARGWFHDAMTGLPSTYDSLLVRTDFTRDGWEAAQAAALAENEDGFRAYVLVVDDPQFAGARWHALRQQAVALEEHAAVLFIVDGPAMAGEHPIQVVDLGSDSRPAFRCVARELWGVENNLNLANMDWDDFAGHVDGDGVFRGFE